jgi:hypothetical protein
LVSSGNAKTLGNWPLGRLLAHLAETINKSIDGMGSRAPLPMRLIGRLIRGRILKNGMPAGFNLPKTREAEAYPAVASPKEGLDMLRQAIHRLTTEKMTAVHPAFGKLSHDQWVQIHLHHAALHLSFALPG